MGRPVEYNTKIDLDFDRQADVFASLEAIIDS